MIYLFLSICCSVSVSILLKLARRYRIDSSQAIAWNYPTAALLCWLIYRPSINLSLVSQSPFYLSLGILLPALFVILAASVRSTGIVRTDIAQRLSLFIPVLSSFVIFSENLSVIKATGLSLAFAAIVCAIPWQKQDDKQASSRGWLYLVTVFVGMGIIDVLFKQIAQNKAVPFTASLLLVFLLATAISFSVLIILFIMRKKRFELINLLCGIILGIANFGNILFYLKAHQALANQPSLVFSGMNIGVIVMGSLAGILIFREKLSRLNYFGIALALVSILVNFIY